MAALYSHAAAAGDPPRPREIEERKDDLMRQLAICESGGHGNSERPIYGGGGTYAGRFQFTIRAVISYVREMDGRVLSSSDALLLAQDYRQAAALAKYMIFVRGDLWNWPGCSRQARPCQSCHQDQGDVTVTPLLPASFDNTLVKSLARGFRWRKRRDEVECPLRGQARRSEGAPITSGLSRRADVRQTGGASPLLRRSCSR